MYCFNYRLKNQTAKKKEFSMEKKKKKKKTH